MRNTQDITVLAPTKTEDGGSQASGDGSDAFSRFSNRNVRMTYLLGLGGTDEENRDSADWMEHVGYQGRRRLRDGAAGEGSNTRKTRISTELHPSAFDGLWFG